MWSDNPERDMESYQTELEERWNRNHVRCSVCGEEIHEEDAIRDMYGQVYCPECLEDR